MPKFKYHIETPHGLITRQSDRVYTHAVYYLSTTRVKEDPAKPGHALRGDNGRVIDEECAPYIADSSFCGSLHLAQKRVAQLSPRQGFIIEATRISRDGSKLVEPSADKYNKRAQQQYAFYKSECAKNCVIARGYDDWFEYHNIGGKAGA